MSALHTRSAACAARPREAACVGCGARAFSVCGGLVGDDLERLDALAETISLRPGDALVREGDPAVHLFSITSGSVRVYKLLPDGRRQITGFLFAGDFLGIAAGDLSAYSAEAIEPSTACRFGRAPFRALMRDCPTLEASLFERATRDLAAAQNQMLLLGRKTAAERLASFLLDLPSHDPQRPGPEGLVRLPMTRGEIADYLGLTIETVSRVLTRFRTSGLIHMLSLAELRIDNPERLRAVADGEL